MTPPQQRRQLPSFATTLCSIATTASIIPNESTPWLVSWQKNGLGEFGNARFRSAVSVSLMIARHVCWMIMMFTVAAVTTDGLVRHISQKDHVAEICPLARV